MKLRNKKTGEIEEIKLKLNESLPDAIRRTVEEAGWEETREPLIKDEEIISFISLLERFDRKISKLCGEEEK